MGWEKSGCGRPYYVISKRVNGQEVRVYAGKGDVGRLAEQLVLLARAERIRVREEEIERDKLMREYEALVNELVDVVCRVMGW